MTLAIRRTGAQDYGRFMKVLVCGDPGAGKTLFSSTFPNPFYASAEGGLMSIADRNIPYANIRSSDDLLAVKTVVDQPPELRRSALGFDVDTVVIDTIDEVQKILIRERLTETKKDSMTLPDWGWLGEQMQALIRGFRNLDLNVIFTCHLRESRDDELGRVYFDPGLQGAIGKNIAGYVDLALVLRSSAKTEVQDGQAIRVTHRYLQTAQDSHFPWLKDRSGKLPAELSIDFDSDFKRLEELIFGGIELTEGASFEIEEAPEVEASPSEESTKETVVDSVATLPEVTQKPQKVQKIVPDLELQQEEVVAVIDTPVTLEEKTDSSSEPETPQVFVCETEGCEEEVGEDQRDLSKIRFRKVLCRDHFTAAKRPGK